MKALPAILVTLATMGAGSLAAQVQDELALSRQEIQANRQQIVADNLGLTETEGQAFWPQYRDYRQEMAKTGDRIQQLILDYAKNYQNLSDEQAKKMVDEWFSIQKEQLSIRQKWIGKFQQILPPKKATRFLQIENRLDTIVQAGLMEQIPLVK
jgi:hypothetical protein